MLRIEARIGELLGPPVEPKEKGRGKKFADAVRRGLLRYDGAAS